MSPTITETSLSKYFCMCLVCGYFEPVLWLGFHRPCNQMTGFKWRRSSGVLIASVQVYVIQRSINTASPQSNAQNHHLMSKSGRFFHFVFSCIDTNSVVISSLGASACKSVSLGSLEPGINNRIVKYTQEWFIELS